MFRQVISKTPLTTEAADAFFTNITGASYSGDKSFLATLRALMYPRMPAGAKISQRFYTANISKDYTTEHNQRDIVHAACQDWDVNGKDYLVVCNVNNRDEDARKACLDAIQNDFPKAFKGWHSMDKVTDLYRKSYRVLCYINPDKRSTILFVDNLNVRRVHYLGVCIMAILPWYFNAEQGMTDLEKKLLFSCKEIESEEPYMACLEEIAKQWNFEEARTRKLLSGFEAKYERVALDEIQRQINRSYEEVQQYENSIASLFERIADQNIRLEGLRAKLAQKEQHGDSDLMEYFLCNKHLHLEEVRDTTMYFEVRGCLTYFNEDMAESYIRNHNSVLYNYPFKGTNGGQMERLWRSVFLGQDEADAGRPVVKMRICAAYSLDLRRGVQGRSGHDFSEFGSGYLRNPHIQNHSCLGQHRRAFDELMKKQDYIGCLEQTVSSCCNISMSEAGVISRMFEEAARGVKCFELPDGRAVNGVEAIEWLEAWDKENAKKGA